MAIHSCAWEWQIGREAIFAEEDPYQDPLHDSSEDLDDVVIGEVGGHRASAAVFGVGLDGVRRREEKRRGERREEREEKLSHLWSVAGVVLSGFLCSPCLLFLLLCPLSLMPMVSVLGPTISN
jgi:hypothetical protein